MLLRINLLHMHTMLVTKAEASMYVYKNYSSEYELHVAMVTGRSLHDNYIIFCVVIIRDGSIFPE